MYVALLAGVALAASRAQETVSSEPAAAVASELRPHVGVPREIRAKFIAPAVTVSVIFALGGFFAALIPSIMSRDLHLTNVAVAGAVVFELFALPLPTILLSRNLASNVAMFSGLAALFPSLALLVLSQERLSLPLLLAGTGFGGVALGLGYRGSLQVVNEIAPDQRRAEVTSAYYIACFTGNALPVIGVGIVASLSNSLVASTTFACVIAALAATGLIAGTRYGR